MQGGAQYTSENIVPSALVGTTLGLATHSAGWGLLGAALTPAVMNAVSGRPSGGRPILGGRSASRKSTRKTRSARKSAKSPRKNRSVRKSRRVNKWVSKVVAKGSLKRGSFSLQAKRAGMSTKAFAKKVIASPSKFSLTTRRRAQFFRNINRHNVAGGNF